jgi:threonine dehydratase
VFPVVQSHLDRVVLVTDDAIREAQRVLWDGLRIAAEPGGVTAFSALLSGAYQPAHDERIGVIISGGNTDAVHFGSPSPRGS